jgi:hypothetical protein
VAPLIFSFLSSQRPSFSLSSSPHDAPWRSQQQHLGRAANAFFLLQTLFSSSSCTCSLGGLRWGFMAPAAVGRALAPPAPPVASPLTTPPSPASSTPVPGGAYAAVPLRPPPTPDAPPRRPLTSLRELPHQHAAVGLLHRPWSARDLVAALSAWLPPRPASPSFLISPSLTPAANPSRPPSSTTVADNAAAARRAAHAPPHHRSGCLPGHPSGSGDHGSPPTPTPKP